MTIEGDVPPAARDQLGLAPGAPAVAADVLAAQQRLLTAMREAGHPLAKVELPPVNLRSAEHLLDVQFRAIEGPSADVDIRCLPRHFLNAHGGVAAVEAAGNDSGQLRG